MQMKRHDNKLFNGVLEVALFGLSLSLGGQLVSWNIGLLSGFYTFWIAVGIVAMGYCCLTYCTAEMTSVLPFSGGSYGLCRVTLGSSMGYMIGCFESLQSVVYAATMASILGSMSTHVFGTPANLEPVWWALVYISAFFLQLMGRNHLAQIIIVVTSVTLLLMAIYCLGTAKDMNFIKFAGGVSHYSGEHESTWGHSRHFMFCLPHACWFFLGTENIPIVCADTVKSVKTVPRAMLYVYCVSVVTGIALLFSCASQSPGITDLAQYSVQSPLMYGYSHLFNISTSLTVLFVIPGTYATAFGFMFIFGRQMNAMAKSGLFPKLLALVYQWKLGQQPHSTEDSELNVDVDAAERVIPVGALVAGSVLGYAILLALFFSGYDRDKIRTLLFNVSLLASFSVNICTFLSFLMYRRKYSSLDKGRPFHNPFGKLRCATVGLCVFVLAAVGVCGFQRDGHLALIIFAVYSVCMAVYYLLVARSRQFFSAEEQAVLIVAYIINANSKGHKKLTRSASFKRENSFSGRIMKRSESMRSLLSREDTNTSANIVVSRQLSVSLRSAATGTGHRANSTRTNSRDMSMSSDKSHPHVPLVESIDEADGNTAVGGVDYPGSSSLSSPQGNSIAFAKLHCINEREEGPKSPRADDHGPGRTTSLPESSLGVSNHKEERVGDTQDCVTVSATDINAAVDSADPMSCEQSLFSTANCTAEADKLACSFTVQDPPAPVQSYSLVAETEEERALVAVERMLSAKQLSSAKKGSTKSRSDVNNNTDSKDGSQRSRGGSLNGGEDASQHSKSSKSSIQARLGLFGGSNKNSHGDSQRNVALFDGVVATKPTKVRQGWMPTSTKAVLPVDTSMSGIALHNSRRQSQYAAPEEEGEEEPLGSVRLKKLRRPSLLSSFLGGFVSHNQSTRGGSFFALTSQPQSSKGGFSMGGSFSALNSSSLSRILPVIDLESPDFDEYTNKVVSRLIADNLGADFLLSLAKNSMERADEEQGQAEQDQKGGEVLVEEAGNEKCADEEGVQKALHRQQHQQKNYNNGNSACDSALEDAMDREVSARILHIARQHYRHSHADYKGWDKGKGQGGKVLDDLV